MRHATTCLAALCLLLSGCVNSGAGLAPEVQNAIPEGASLIRLTSDQSPSDYYDTIYQHLAREGYEITQSDADQNALSTAPKTSGQSTTLAMRVFVEEQDQGGSIALLRGRWGVSGSMASGMSAAFSAGMDKDVGEPAVWRQRNRAGVAFGQMVKTAQEIPHDNMEYEAD